MQEYKRFVWIVFLILILSNLIIVINSERCKATGKEIFVDDNPYLYLYRDGTAEHPLETINDALRIAEDGDTIYVFGGNYNETLNINKRVTLVGSIYEGNSVINYGSDHKYTIEIEADNVNITGFEINDLGNRVVSQIGGALIHVTSSNVIIQNNNITNCTNGYGIYLDSSDNQLIKNNTIEKVITGAYVSSSNTNDFAENKISNCSSYGIEIDSSYYNTLYNNTFNTNYYGIELKNSYDINISNNTINNNSEGVSVYGGSSSTIDNNLISNNSDSGLYITSPDSNIFNNTLEYNQIGMKISASNCNIYGNFINHSFSKGIYAVSETVGNIFYLNYLQGNLINAFEQGKNKWYSESLTKGNSWDDYGEVDWIPNGTGDGIGDVPYQKNGVYDKYPLGIFLKPPNKPTNPHPTDGQDNVGLKINLSVYVTDPDSTLVNVYFYRTYLDNSMPDVELGHDINIPVGSSASCMFNLNFNTTFFWYVVVNDSKLENRSDIWFFVTRIRPASNIPPVAVITSPSNAVINESVVFDASRSNDSDGTIDFYRWNFGDETSEILSVSPTHVYYSNGTYTVTLIVIDNNGSSANQIKTIDVTSSPLNILPIANAGGPYSGYVGSTITFLGSGSDTDGTIVGYRWDFENDGAYDTDWSTTATATHVYSSAGIYTANLTVKDNRDGTNSSLVRVSIKSRVSDGTPGFELIIVFAAVAMILIWKRRNRL